MGIIVEKSEAIIIPKNFHNGPIVIHKFFFGKCFQHKSEVDFIGLCITILKKYKLMIYKYFKAIPREVNW